MNPSGRWNDGPFLRKGTRVVIGGSQRTLRNPQLIAVCCAVWLGILTSGRCLTLSAETRPVEFTNDLVPVMTKLGCNAGACHGAALGRGGFKLSLYGGNPDADYDAITRQLEGRRINLARPDESLLILKPTEQLEHGGGQRMEWDQDEAELVRRWIHEGGLNHHGSPLTRIDVSPTRYVTNSPMERVALKSMAHYADGTTRDVTRWTIFSAEDESAVHIDEAAMSAVAQRSGRHLVIARFLDQVVPLEILVPLSSHQVVETKSTQQKHFIDVEIDDALRVLGLPKSSAADDATFLRRVSLDLTGRLPDVQHTRDFLQTQDANKRGVLVDQLLHSEAFTDYWTMKFAQWLRIRPKAQDVEGMMVYHGWLREQIASDAGYDEWVRSLLMAEGDSHQFGPANFFRTTDGPRKQAEFFSELFMGSRLRCANCHNHPLDRWTQDDYHGLAAIFAKVDGRQIVKANPRGNVIHPRTLEPATPKIPGSHSIQDEQDGREVLAEWMLDEQNPYFRKAIVNRLWKAMMGRGLVEPVDDFRATNPATHPALLDQLAEDFSNNGFKIRDTLRSIVLSDAYSRDSRALEGNQHDDRFYSRAFRSPLEPEVMADAISDVLEVADSYGQEPVGTRAVSLVSPSVQSPTLDILGRCGREESCEGGSGSSAGLAQKLHVFNGGLLNRRIHDSEGRLQRLLAEGQSTIQIIEQFYVAALCRKPAAAEREHWEAELAKANDAAERQAYLEDFVWSLLTCNEFRFNH